MTRQQCDVPARIAGELIQTENLGAFYQLWVSGWGTPDRPYGVHVLPGEWLSPTIVYGTDVIQGSQQFQYRRLGGDNSNYQLAFLRGSIRAVGNILTGSVLFTLPSETPIFSSSVQYVHAIRDTTGGEFFAQVVSFDTTANDFACVTRELVPSGQHILFSGVVLMG